MTCPEAQPLLNAFLDGELDLSASVGMQQHVESCHSCASEYRKLELVRAELAGVDLDLATEEVLQRIRSSVERRGGLRRRTQWWKTAWREPALIAATAAVVALVLLLPGRFAAGHDFTEREIVDMHLRSLLGDHLVDVPSSDRHTVKPWFQGKLEFAPPVPDLTAKGFVLAGGRLDVLETRKVAALVYRRREHVINVWISQGSAGLGELQLSEVSGYHVIRWSNGGMIFRAVSDLDVQELRLFANTIRAK